MNKILYAMLVAVPIALNPLFGASAAAATEQQQKMVTCNKEAGDRKGEERKAFMKACLSAKPVVSDAQKAQQEKMKICNAEAKGLKGEERRKFMSDCLKKDNTE